MGCAQRSTGVERDPECHLGLTGSLDRPARESGSERGCCELVEELPVLVSSNEQQAQTAGIKKFTEETDHMIDRFVDTVQNLGSSSDRMAEIFRICTARWTPPPRCSTMSTPSPHRPTCCIERGHRGGAPVMRGMFRRGGGRGAQPGQRTSQFSARSATCSARSRSPSPRSMCRSIRPPTPISASPPSQKENVAEMGLRSMRSTIMPRRNRNTLQRSRRRSTTW